MQFSPSQRLIDLYQRRPRLTGLVAGFLALLLVSGFHLFVHFTTAFRSLYIFPIWISTRLGGRWVGLIIVALTAILEGLFELGFTRDFSSYRFLSDTLIRFGSLGAIMLLFAQLEDALTRYQIHARHDPLTGLLNRRALDEYATLAFQHAQRRSQPFVVAVVDCDGFKQLNDRHGHEAGDQALKLLAQVLEGNIRSTDFVSRIGGDEFVLILQGSDDEEVKAILTRVNKAFVETIARHGWQSSISSGYCALTDRHEKLEDLIKSADENMFKAKELKKQSALYVS